MLNVYVPLASHESILKTQVFFSSAQAILTGVTVGAFINHTFLLPSKVSPIVHPIKCTLVANMPFFVGHSMHSFLTFLSLDNDLLTIFKELVFFLAISSMFFFGW